MSAALESLLDHRAIEAVLVRYATALDSKDWPRLQSCFTPDAVADYEGIGLREGYKSIQDACQGALEPLDASQHLVTNIEADVTGDVATARCYFQAQHVRSGTPGGDNFIIAGRYEDELVRRSESWVIRRRVLRVLWTEGNPAVVGADA